MVWAAGSCGLGLASDHGCKLFEEYKISIIVSDHQHTRDNNERWFETAGPCSLVVKLLAMIALSSGLDHLFLAKNYV